MVSVSKNQQFEIHQATDNLMSLYRPANGKSTTSFVFKPAFENFENYERKKSLDEIYNLSFFLTKLKSQNINDTVQTLNLDHSIPKWMRDQHVLIDEEFINDEEDIKWIRSILIQEFFKIDLDQLVTVKQNTLAKLYEDNSDSEDENCTKYMRGLNITDASPSQLRAIQINLRRAIKNKILRTSDDSFRSKTMNEFLGNLEAKYEDTKKTVERYLEVLYQMHRAVTIFDLIKAKVVEKFEGEHREIVQDAKTWESFISALEIQRIESASDLFIKKFHPAVLDKNEFDRDILNATTQLELKTVVTARVNGIIKLREEFERAYGTEYLTPFLLHSQYLKIIAVYSKLHELNAAGGENKQLKKLLTPREPLEYIQEANGDGGMCFFKELASYNSTILKSARAGDRFYKPVKYPES